MKRALTARQILLMAAKLVERGWCRRVRQRRSGRVTHYCLAGAVSQAAFGNADRNLPVELVAPLQAATGALFVAIWNDKQTSKRPVISALRRAADKAGAA